MVRTPDLNGIHSCVISTSNMMFQLKTRDVTSFVNAKEVVEKTNYCILLYKACIAWISNCVLLLHLRVCLQAGINHYKVELELQLFWPYPGTETYALKSDNVLIEINFVPSKPLEYQISDITEKYFLFINILELCTILKSIPCTLYTLSWIIKREMHLYCISIKYNQLRRKSI